jgi:hypothetical protein
VWWQQPLGMKTPDRAKNPKKPQISPLVAIENSVCRLNNNYVKGN